MERQCIYPKEVQFITGKSERHGRNVLKKIREINNKLPHQLVTIEEFCDYLGLKYEKISALLR